MNKELDMDKKNQEDLVKKWRLDLIAFWEEQPTLDPEDSLLAMVYLLDSAFRLEVARAISIARGR